MWSFCLISIFSNGKVAKLAVMPQPLKEICEVFWIESSTLGQMFVVIRERDERVIFVKGRFEHDPMGPNAPPINAAGHALTAAKCVPPNNVWVLTMHPTSSSRFAWDEENDGAGNMCDGAYVCGGKPLATSID